MMHALMTWVVDTGTPRLLAPRIVSAGTDHSGNRTMALHVRSAGRVVTQHCGDNRATHGLAQGWMSPSNVKPSKM